MCHTWQWQWHKCHRWAPVTLLCHRSSPVTLEGVTGEDSDSIRCHRCLPVTWVTAHVTILHCDILEGFFYRRWTTVWKIHPFSTKVNMYFFGDFLEYELCMIMHAGDQQSKEKVHHPWKSSCSKWCTTWIKEERSTEEANGGHWWWRRCILQASRLKEKTTKEQTQSDGSCEECERDRKKH